jgi:transcription elongation factor Elf1
MAYDINCRTCNEHTRANNIVDLLKENTDKDGKFVCSHCGGTDTYIFRESNLQEEGEVWKRWIKGVIQIDTGIDTYSPYIFLTADSEDREPTGLHFHYYKDTRNSPNGKLKHGHGPGGPPVLSNGNLLDIIKHLIKIGIMSVDDIQQFINDVKNEIHK